MRSIILAAGEGNRLRPYTNSIPKSLVRIGNFTMLEYQLELFKKNNIECTVVAGYLSEKIKEVSNNVIVNEKYASTNMLYTLFRAVHLFDTDLIISYGDIVYTEKTLKSLIKDKNQISLTIDKNWREYWSMRYSDPLADLETLVKKDNLLIEIGNKPENFEKIQGQYMGLIKISKSIINKIINVYEECKKSGKIQQKDYKNAYLTDFIQELIDRSINVNTVEIDDPWIEIDSIDDFENIETKRRLNEILKINNEN